jgi:tetratricopeptide (TPR) repeat protein
MRGCLKILGITVGVLVLIFAVVGIVFWLNWKRGNELSDQAQDAYRNGNPAEALAYYQEFLTIKGLTDREEDDAHDKIEELEDYLNAVNLQENGQLTEAITAYRTFIDEHFRDWTLDYLYCSLARKELANLIPEHAQQLHRKGDYPEAIEVYLSSLSLEPIGDEECPSESTWDDRGKACHEADTAIEQSHETALASIQAVIFDWTETLGALEDYQNFDDEIRDLLTNHPETLVDQQVKVAIAEVYSDWAALLREGESYALAIEKYQLILSRYRNTPAGEVAHAALEETRVEQATWLSENPAVPVLEFPQEVSRDDEDRWSWTTVFKETGGKVGYTLSGTGWIESAEGHRYGPWGDFVDRGSVTVTAGGEAEDDYWVRGETFEDGYAVFTWEGEDEGGNPITIEERVHLLP